MTELATLFAQAKTGCIVVDGRRIYSILRIRVEMPSLLRLRQLHAKTDPLPGLRFAIRDGTATLRGGKVRDLILWSDLDPAEVEINIIPKRKKVAEVMLWGCWRDVRDGYTITQDWLVNSGMLVEESENAWVLRCNSGPNAALTFDDLVVEVNLTPQAKP
jgi:hypothetical protein